MQAALCYASSGAVRTSTRSDQSPPFHQSQSEPETLKGTTILPSPAMLLRQRGHMTQPGIPPREQVTLWSLGLGLSRAVTYFVVASSGSRGPAGVQHASQRDGDTRHAQTAPTDKNKQSLRIIPATRLLRNAALPHLLTVPPHFLFHTQTAANSFR